MAISDNSEWVVSDYMYLWIWGTIYWSSVPYVYTEILTNISDSISRLSDPRSFLPGAMSTAVQQSESGAKTGTPGPGDAGAGAGQPALSRDSSQLTAAEKSTGVAAPRAAKNMESNASLKWPQSETVSETESQDLDQNVSSLGNDVPDGVNPRVWDMLCSIKHDTDGAMESIDNLDHRVVILEDQSDHMGAHIEKLQKMFGTLANENKIPTGRLIRAEKQIARQQNEIMDLKSRSMRDNMIIKTKGPKYKETHNEDTSVTFKKFVAQKLHLPNSDRISISRSHRMGKARGEYNCMIIAKVVNDSDQRKILENASALKDTGFSVTKQIPPEVEERKQFAWGEFRKARTDGKQAKFDVQKLYIDNELQQQFEPFPLPSQVSSVVPLHVGRSNKVTDGTHEFRGYAIEMQSIQNVRNALDYLLKHEDVANADHLPYAFRSSDPSTTSRLFENFNSDGDTGTGLMILKSLQTNKVMNLAVFVTHSGSGYITHKKKIECINGVVAEALMALKSIADA